MRKRALKWETRGRGLRGRVAECGGKAEGTRVAAAVPLWARRPCGVCPGTPPSASPGNALLCVISRMCPCDSSHRWPSRAARSTRVCVASPRTRAVCAVRDSRDALISVSAGDCTNMKGF